MFHNVRSCWLPCVEQPLRMPVHPWNQRLTCGLLSHAHSHCVCVQEILTEPCLWLVQLFWSSMSIVFAITLIIFFSLFWRLFSLLRDIFCHQLPPKNTDKTNGDKKYALTCQRKIFVPAIVAIWCLVKGGLLCGKYDYSRANRQTEYAFLLQAVVI